MDADRLSRFGCLWKKHAGGFWQAAKCQLAHGSQWLTRRSRPTLLIIIGCLLLALCHRYWPKVWEAYTRIWEAYTLHPDRFTPFFTPTAALLVGLAAFGQWRIARLRHEEQTNADRQRRITDGFSKAIEQLGSDKLEVRLGGIYALERIARESRSDYWNIMETLTAFVRERTCLPMPDISISETLVRFYQSEVLAADARAYHKPPTDIAAVLTVITRRSKADRRHERNKDWRLDLSGADLRCASLSDAHLEGAVLTNAHLEDASLTNAHLEGAILTDAHLEGANLLGVHLEKATLWRAHFKDASLAGAHLEDASFADAHLEGAVLVNSHCEGATFWHAHLEGASLEGAHLEKAQLEFAFGNAATRLPTNVARPARWDRPSIVTNYSGNS